MQRDDAPTSLLGVGIWRSRVEGRGSRVEGRGSREQDDAPTSLVRGLGRGEENRGYCRVPKLNVCVVVGHLLMRCVLQERLGAQPLLLQIPIGRYGSFRGVVDLLDMKAVVYDKTGDGKEFSELSLLDAGAAGEFEAAGVKQDTPKP
jgi:hypothetical protein